MPAPEPLPAEAPCVIVGGGIAGVALAAHLGAHGMRGVVVLEKERTLGAGATGRSAGGIRQQFADPEAVRAARATVRILDGFAATTGVDPDFRRHGYLLLATEDARAAALRAEAAAQRRLGLDVATLDADAVRRRFPVLEAGDVRAANFCASDGYLSPHGLVEGFKSLARRGGARFVLEAPVVRVEVERGRVAGARTARGTVRSPRVVVAAGAEAGRLLGAAGVDLPLRPTLRRIFATRPLPSLPADLPLVIDLDRPFYFRPESGGAILSLAEVEEGGVPEVVEYDGDAPPDRLLERAVHRAPVLAEARLLRSWSGHRTLTPDDRPILGEAPGVRGLWLAVGFGGHGITHAPSLTLALAEAIVLGAARTLSLEPFRPDRSGLAAPPPPPGVL